MQDTFNVKRSMMAFWLATAGVAMGTPAHAAAGQVMFHVPAGSLDNVLTEIAAQAGRRITFDPATVRGKSAPAVNGSMAPDSAARMALDGSGLMLKTTAGGEWLVVPIPGADGGGKLLSTVRVTAAGAGVAAGGTPAGANGSSDPIATEGTRSYTTNATTIASKTPLALKDTPQAVSVLTRTQIDDRVINSFTDGLDALPGVSSVQTAQGPNFFSRGFQINNVQIDGGSPIFIGATGNGNFTSNYSVLDDLSIYDSVAIQRGAAGTFTGVGSPGGSIGLERKRPLDHRMLDITVQGGSYNQLRTVVDASSPEWLGGLVKARTVLTGERNEYFYDNASRRFLQGYVNVEVTPSTATTINLGGKISTSRDTPFWGLPTNADGKLLDLPRGTCLCTPWSRTNTNTREVFAQLRQKLFDNWDLRLNGQITWQDINFNTFAFTPTFGKIGVRPGVVNEGTATAFRAKRRSDQYLLDGYVHGTFSIGQVAFDLTTGANYQLIRQSLADISGFFAYRNYVIIPFDAARFPQPAASDYSLDYQTAYPQDQQIQYGAYATLRISPWSWAHLTIAERYSGYRTAVKTATYYGQGVAPDISTNTTSTSNLAYPNVGLVLDVTKTVSFYGNYNTIFDHFNYYQADGNPVKPLTGANAEVGMKEALANGTLNLSQSIFYIRSRNTPVFDPSGRYSQNPTTGSQCCYLTDGTENRSKGFEFQVQGALTRSLNLDASYTYTHSSQKAGTVLTTAGLVPLQQQVPDHLLKAFATWRVPVLNNRLIVGLGGHVESSVAPYARLQTYDRPTRKFKTTYVYTPRDGYATVDAMLKFMIQPRLSLQANVTNLFDRKYYSTVMASMGSYYGQPRTALLTLRGSF